MRNDEEIEAAEKLTAKGEFTIALVLTQDMLVRAEYDDARRPLQLMGEVRRSQGRSKRKRYRLFLQSSAIVILINPSTVWLEVGFSKCLMRN
jgi:hypothetical protein